MSPSTTSSDEDPMGGLIVIDPGLSTTVQDAGRPGYREWGVSPGGAFDRGTAGLANALVGNDVGCAVLELTLIGGIYRADGPLAMAMAGAPMEAKVVAADGGETLLTIPLSWSLGDGDRLVLGRAPEGARTYLAVRGGWQMPLRLGSRSSEERLRAGAVLPAEPGSIPTRHPAGPTWTSPAAEPFRILDGPDVLRADSGFDPSSFWTDRRFRIGSRSDRMGLRLEGEPVAIVSPPDRLSAPVAPGAVQVAGGQLIVLGVACGTMGGYPHVAHVISADLDRLGQLRPGDLIRFHRVGLDEARRADQAMRQDRQALLKRVATAALDT
jgi:5-oxoprolinase (ATP-hydrolysing) subunit C